MGPSQQTVMLRPATLDDVPLLQAWDREPHVIACSTDDPTATTAFDGSDWAEEIAGASDVSYHLIAEVDGRPIGAMQIIDPLAEPTHYWGARWNRTSGPRHLDRREGRAGPWIRNRDDDRGDRQRLCRPVDGRDHHRSAELEHRCASLLSAARIPHRREADIRRRRLPGPQALTGRCGRRGLGRTTGGLAEHRANVRAIRTVTVSVQGPHDQQESFNRDHHCHRGR